MASIKVSEKKKMIQKLVKLRMKLRNVSLQTFVRELLLKGLLPSNEEMAVYLADKEDIGCLDLNLQNDYLFVSFEGVNLFVIGTLNNEGEISFLLSSTEGRDELQEEVRRHLKGQISGTIESGWKWFEFPEGAFRLAFNEGEYNGLFIERLLEARRLHREGKFEWEWKDALQYAETVRALARGDDPFQGVSSQYEGWLATCQRLGLKGWPQN